MKEIVRRAGAFVCSAAIAMCVAGCGQPASTTQGSDDGAQDQAQPQAQSQPQTQDQSQDQQPAESAKRDQTDPTADGRIDVTTTGTQVATYSGPKYIVSDVTVDQQTGAGAAEGLGLQEICVVNQPASWEPIDSIGWDRNNISYTGVAMPWGVASYRYSYINEASGVEGIEEWSLTSEDRYFASYDTVEHLELDGHKIAYAFDNAIMGAAGIVDLEAQGAAQGSANTLTVFAYEQRDDKCAFIVTITCDIEGDASEVSAEQVVRDAYAPLSFKSANEQVDAASFLSDLTISNADGSKSLVIARNNEALISYTEHSVMLLSAADEMETLATTVYDFAPTDAAPEDGEKHEVDGKTALVEWDEYGIVAWLDIDGSALRVETTLRGGEQVDDALTRAISGRLK